MSAMDEVVRCPACGDGFRLGTERCPDCRVELEAPGEAEVGAGVGPAGPPVSGGGPADEVPATLELHHLTDEARRLVDQLLTARLVRHTWQGSDLLVPARLVGEAELAVEQATAMGTGSATGDGPTVIYEVAGWPVALHARLAELLDEARIRHEWDPQGDLVVSEADEEAVEALFDQLDESELAGAPDPLGVLDVLHGHLSRLVREPIDGRARQGVVDAAADLRRASLPFGFDPPVWRSLVQATLRLADQLPALDANRVRERAAALRAELQSWL